MASSEDLRDVWYAEDGKVAARGDAAAIDEMLATKLEEVRTEEGGWVVIFRHRDTNQLGNSAALRASYMAAAQGGSV